MEVERIRFTIAADAVNEELRKQGAENITWVGAFGRDEGRVMAEFPAAEGENEMRNTVRREPFEAWAIAVWWLGEEWQVLDVRVEPCGVVGHAEASGKEAKHERA